MTAREVLSAARSTKAGARTPATLQDWQAVGRRHGDALNEGRGANPGDTGNQGCGAMRVDGRSTKAGARTPATPARLSAQPCLLNTLNEGRGANPGDTCSRSAARQSQEPLNEGRGANPGDTCHSLLRQ